MSSSQTSANIIVANGIMTKHRSQKLKHHQAGCGFEEGVPGVQHRYAQDGGPHQQALVLRPWASPGHLADEFRRRAGLRSRGRKSCARVRKDELLIDPSS